MKTIFSFSLIIGSLLGGYSIIFATSEADISFPVAELGNCQTEETCKTYCDDPAHADACLAFAEKHNLIPPDDLEKARKFREIGTGPGSCSSERECEAYCSEIRNMEECLSFAEQHGFMDEHELTEAKKVLQALAGGAETPGSCQTREQCEAYCSDSSHMRECIEFGERSGLIPPDELREAKQVLKALEAGVKMPGDCRGKDECEAYCSDPSNMEECVEFGIAAGFIGPEEAEEVRRILPLMKEGRMPGGCRDKDECEAYCSEEANIDECTTFFLEAGFMTQEEVEVFRKTGGRGPGGCRGQECETFCNNPANQETCFQFALDNGLIPEEQLQEMKEGMRRMQEDLAAAPAEVAQCLKEKIGGEVLQRIQAGTFTPNAQVGDQMRQCFEEFMPRPGDFPGGAEGFAPSQGPGGCRTEVECLEFCSHPENQEVCDQFQGGDLGQAQQTRPPEADCVERIVGKGALGTQPTPEQGERIAIECFGASPDQFRRPAPEEFQDVPQEQFEQTQEHFEEQGEPSEVSPEQLPGALLNAFQPLLRVLLR